MTFGERLKQIRELVGLTPAQLARESGVSRQTISMLESGKRKGLSAGVARKLAQALGVTVDHLLGDSELETEGAVAFSA